MIQINGSSTSMSVGNEQNPPYKRENKGQSLIKLSGEFVIIDIETTGLSTFWDEIIEVSAIKYDKNGVITGGFTELVQPPMIDGRYVDDFIESLTGITNEMLKDARTIEQVLPEYLSFIDNSFVVGYNVNFDINFIYDKAEELNLTPFTNNYMDVMRLARKVRKDLDHHRLVDMAEAYDVDYSEAHRSLADCIITKKVFDKLREQAIDIYGSEDAVLISFNKKSSKRIKVSDITADADNIDPDNPLYSKVVVFTGTLERMERKTAWQIVANMGGVPADNITKKTNYLVLGNNDYCSLIKDGKSSKHKKAEELKLNGQDIEIIPENVFYEMIFDNY